MNWKSVTSSNIDEIAFEEETNFIYVKFKNQSVYRYYDCSEALFTKFLKADSKGKFLNTYFKKTGKKYDKISG